MTAKEAESWAVRQFPLLSMALLAAVLLCGCASGKGSVVTGTNPFSCSTPDSQQNEDLLVSLPNAVGAQTVNFTVLHGGQVVIPPTDVQVADPEATSFAIHFWPSVDLCYPEDWGGQGIPTTLDQYGNGVIASQTTYAVKIVRSSDAKVIAEGNVTAAP